MTVIKIYDSFSKQLRDLPVPSDGPIGIYACGPTVYSRIHVGNARPFVLFALLKRFLVHAGHDVRLVYNVTDINDKIYDAARQAGKASTELAAEMTAAYFADTDRLGLGRPDHEPLASETVDAIIELIATLIEKDHAYAVDGDVYFRVRSLPEYGRLSGRQLDEMDQGEGNEGQARKQDPFDFALWKARKPDEDSYWDAPWGQGRPGWHIECSAMAEQFLGLEFAIHGGGADLIFPHHENEIAQTYAARGRQLAKLWMHNGMVELPDSAGAGEKMSKSIGNVRGLSAALDQFGRDALIWFFCNGRYRQPLAFTPEAMAAAKASIERIRDAGRRLVDGPSPSELTEYRDRFFAALADDFNTPEALANLFGWIAAANKLAEPIGNSELIEMLSILGLENLLERQEAPSELIEFARQRQLARANRDFAAADRLRDEIAAAGWVVRDTADGFELVRA